MNRLTPSCVTALALLLIIAPFAHAEPKVTAQSEYGFITDNVVTINASPDEVWQKLIYGVDTWWPKDHSWWGQDGTFSISPKAGGCFCETAGDKSAEHLHVVFVDPNKKLVMTGGLGPLQGMGLFGALTFELTEQDDSTKVSMTYRVHGYYPDGYQQLAPIVAQVQGLQLQGLANAF